MVGHHISVFHQQTFPEAIAPTEEPPAVETNSVGCSLEGRRILLLDDDRTVTFALG